MVFTLLQLELQWHIFFVTLNCVGFCVSVLQVRRCECPLEGEGG